MRAITLLSWWKLKNSLRTLISDPRKFIPALFFGLVMTCSLGGAVFGLNQPMPNPVTKSFDPHLTDAAVLLILIFDGFLVIDSGLGEGLLAFGMPDVDYLFPSPISRRIVLAYRLPAIAFTTLFTTGLSLFLIRMVSNMIPTTLGSGSAGTGVVPLIVLLSTGIWMNLALFLSVRIPDRRKIRKVEGFTFLGIAAALGLYGWVQGLESGANLVQSPVVRGLFYPATLAADAIRASNGHLEISSYIVWLVLGYLVTLVPVFASNANWYEQSIISSERISAMRRAAKGGMASMMASQASRTKYKATKAYTVKPFGEGAMSLFWAHLCAAAKRPWSNFIGPVLAGLGLGAWGVIASIHDSDLAGSLAFPMLIYSCVLFMGSAKTASEAAIRRRELLAPLPISGKHSVTANLGVPVFSAFLFSSFATFVYGIGQGPYTGLVCFSMGVLFPLRLAARMILQYAQVLGYPDLADKVQQFLAQGVYYVLAIPLVIAEIVICIPAMVLHSWWMAVVTLSVFQVILLAVLIPLTGTVSDRAVATGEPVSLWRTVRPKKAKAPA